MGNSDVTTHKFTAILSKKVDAGKIMNALAHMSLGIVANNLDKIQDMNFGDYIDKDSGIHPSLSNNSYVILRADNGNQIRSVRNLAKKKRNPLHRLHQYNARRNISGTARTYKKYSGGRA